MIEVILFALVLKSLAIKWLTTLSIKDRYTRLNAASEDYLQVN